MRKTVYILLFCITMATILIGFILLKRTQFSIGLNNNTNVYIADALQDGVDTYTLSFTTGGYANWYLTTTDYYYGADSIRSGSIGNSLYSSVYSSVAGPGTIQFYWKVSSESNYDFLTFYVDSSQVFSISGNVGWQLKSYSLGAGGHTLEWRYSKDGSIASGFDCGWVDYIQWSGGLGITLLSDDLPVYQNYIFGTFYNYTIPTASSSHYHTVWLQPTNSTNDFNLNLYSDSAYSNLLTSSVQGAGALDWVVFRPSAAQSYYPKGNAYSGTGPAYIEWEDSSSIISTGPVGYSCAVSSLDCIEMYKAYLSSGHTYHFYLDNPSTADYDLYLYRLSSGSATNYAGSIRNSTTVGQGLDESISNYIPLNSDYYAIILTWKSGSGTAYLYFNTSTLANDIPLFQSCISGTYYNYNTETAYPSSYSTVWLQPTSSTYDFNLYLYSDSAYSNLLTSSLQGAGALEWVVFRPSAAQSYYPKVHAYSGTGSAYIEWEYSSVTVSIGNGYSCSVSSASCIETYMVYLFNTSSYNFILDNPSTADYDLYLYRLSAGSATNYAGSIRSSTTVGLGSDESISFFTPSYSDNYVILIVWKSGSGTAYLYPSYVILSDDVPLSQSYTSGTYYYYRTGTASSSYYQIVWLLPTSSTNDFNLYLYSNSAYSNLLTSSVQGAGALDWVLFRPSASQSYYPKAHAYSGSGTAYIEWEDSSYSISIGSSYSCSVSSASCIETYMVYLNSGSIYQFNLDNPSTADYDLYLYQLSAGSATNYAGSIRSSTTVGQGYDESISNYIPSFSDYYAILIVWKSGSGTAYLDPNTSTLSDDIPLYQSYTSGTYYYYQVATASSAYYHTVWLQPPVSTNDFNLYLYSDSAYSNLLTSSVQGAGALEWVVFRPSASQSYYPKVHAYSGTGMAYMEWEDSSSSLSIGSSYSCALSSSNCIETYMVYLSSTSSYNFLLDNPSTADYDLYLYWLSSGTTTNYAGAIRSSTTVGQGSDESISPFTPSFSDYYVILIVWKSGSGTAYLYPSYIILSDNVPISQSYNSGTYYYYRTGTVSTSYYHTVWLQPSSSINDFNLYLYSDSAYSNLLTSSVQGAGTLDWVVFRPSASQAYYPKGYAYSGVGTAYIEWEDSSYSISIGSGGYSVAVGSSDCIETYMVYLSSGYMYQFNLDNPSTADYDLYLYRLSSGTATNYAGSVRSSTTGGQGSDESISNYIPSYTDYYAILIVWKSGSGTAYLYPSSSTLPDDVPLSQSFTSGTYYYYQVATASSAYYHTVWLQPSSSTNDFNLYLYSDSAFSNLLTSSLQGAGALEWVVFRPSVSQSYYPKVHANSGTGMAYMEWEDSSYSISIGSGGYSVAVGSSDCIETYMVYLSSGSMYHFNLDNPSTADYDLYLYRLSSGSATNYAGSIRSSTTGGQGSDESISNYIPSFSDYYAILIVWKSGSGTAYLYPTTSTLSDDISLSQSYTSGSYYYYHIATPSSSYYHTVWLQPASSTNNFNLYLYSDSAYSNLLTSSLRGAGALDWVVFRPSASQSYYSKAYAYSGSGTAYIEWEDSSSSLSIGSSYSCSVSSSSCIETYMIYLSTSREYSFSLNNPTGADFDLYLYQLTAGNATNYAGSIRSSTNTGQGYDEFISCYAPSYSDYYTIIVIWKSGSGSATLFVSSLDISDILSDDVSSDHYITSSSYNYYRTGYALYDNYYVVWLQPSDLSDNFYLYLYSDSAYSNYIEGASRGSGSLNWILFRPYSSGYYYPEVYGYSGSGYTYIEWESDSSLSEDSSVSAALSDSDCLELYIIFLTSYTTYSFSLDVPSGGDFDLYIYYLSTGSATDYAGYSSCSINYGSGNDESISDFSPSVSGYYAIIVSRASGSGTFRLSEGNAIRPTPAISIFVVFGILAVIGASAGVYKKYITQQRTRLTTQHHQPVQISSESIKHVYLKPESPKSIRKGPIFVVCDYCQSKNDLNELFCNVCGSEL